MHKFWICFALIIVCMDSWFPPENPCANRLIWDISMWQYAYAESMRGFRVFFVEFRSTLLAEDFIIKMSRKTAKSLKKIYRINFYKSLFHFRISILHVAVIWMLTEQRYGIYNKLVYSFQTALTQSERKQENFFFVFIARWNPPCALGRQPKTFFYEFISSQPTRWNKKTDKEFLLGQHLHNTRRSQCKRCCDRNSKNTLSPPRKNRTFCCFSGGKKTRSKIFCQFPCHT